MRRADALARPGGWLFLAGLALFLAAAGWTVGDMVLPPPAARCPAIRPTGPADHIRILDIGAAELRLRGGLCLVVDNVVSARALASKRAAVAAARREVAQTDAVPATVGAPVAARIGPRDRYRRYHYVPPPSAVTRDVAKARRDAAAAALAAAEADLADLTGPRRLALFLNGEPAPVAVRSVRGAAAPQAVMFALRPEDRATNARSAYWRTLLGGSGEAGLVPVTVGVGDPGAPAPAATLRATPVRNGGIAEPLGLRVYRPAILWLAAFGLTLMLAGLAGIAGPTALLREGPSRHSRFSLSRVQMAWWFGLTLAGFGYIWLVTGQYLDVIGAATFVLPGIAGVTALAARVVSRPPQARAGAAATRGFFADIAGGDRIELHRLQLIAWTIVLGAIYAYNALANFTLARFDANLLALAGVVNGVYVAMKTQET